MIGRRAPFSTPVYRAAAHAALGLIWLSACAPNFAELGREFGEAGASGDALSMTPVGGDSSDGGAGSGGSLPIQGGAPSAAGGSGRAGAALAGSTFGGAAGLPGNAGSSAAGESASGGSGGFFTEAGRGGGGASGGDTTAIAGAGGTRPVLELPVASAFSEELGAGNVAGSAIDGTLDTKWCASDGSAPQWWQVDLRQVQAFTGVVIEFEHSRPYPYTLLVSDDGVDFEVALDRTNNTTSTATQTEDVAAHARYVRIYFPSLPPPDPWPHWACLREFTLLGSTPYVPEVGAGAAGAAGATGM